MTRILPRVVFLVFLLSLFCVSVAGIGRQDDNQQGPVYKVPKKKSREPQPQLGAKSPRRQTHGNASPGKQSSVQPRPRGSQGAGRGQTEQDAVLPQQRYATERHLSRKLGSNGLRELLTQIESMKTEAANGRGAPMSDRWWDGARPRTGNDDGLRPSGTPFFQTNSAYKRMTTQDAQQITDHYGSVPGGIVFEGIAAGLGVIDNVRYDRRFNAFILDDRAAYFVKVPPKTLAALCRAMAEDEMGRIGVSVGDTPLLYGKVPKDSEIAMDLKAADWFLSDVVFVRDDGWSQGYRFANGFQPEPIQDKSIELAVFFKLSGVQFQIEQEEERLTQQNFDVQLVPLSKSAASDGGLAPDNALISQGRVSPEAEANARHVAENISYYRREKIIARVFVYGEVTAFIRALKRADFDLEALADNISGGSL